MSLVVCKIISGQIIMSSDTRGWDDIAKRSNVFKGYLKTVILSPSICIGWAGHVDTAQQAFESIPPQLITNSSVVDLCNHFATYSGSSGEYDSADFIVAHIDGTPTIYKICNNMVKVETGVVWIGNGDAYHKLLNYWHKHREQTPDNQILSFDGAFGDLITNASPEDDVGDFLITAKSSPEGFQYLSYGRCYFPTMRLAGGELEKIPLCTNAEGGYLVSCLTASYNEKPGCALYFMPDGFGFVLDPASPFGFSEIKRLPIQEFLKYVWVNYQIEISGVVPDFDGRFKLYGSRAMHLNTHYEVSSDIDNVTDIELKLMKE